MTFSFKLRMKLGYLEIMGSHQMACLTVISIFFLCLMSQSVSIEKNIFSFQLQAEKVCGLLTTTTKTFSISTAQTKL